MAQSLDQPYFDSTFLFQETLCASVKPSDGLLGNSQQVTLTSHKQKLEIPFQFTPVVVSGRATNAANVSKVVQSIS